MKLMGQTNDPVLVTIPDTKYNITWNLGTCIIVHNLGCPVLIGEPGKSRNSILTDPVKKVIQTLDQNNCSVSIPYASNDFNQFYQKTFIAKCFLCQAQQISRFLRFCFFSLLTH